MNDEYLRLLQLVRDSVDSAEESLRVTFDDIDSSGYVMGRMKELLQRALDAIALIQSEIKTQERNER